MLELSGLSTSMLEVPVLSRGMLELSGLSMSMLEVPGLNRGMLELSGLSRDIFDVSGLSMVHVNSPLLEYGHIKGLWLDEYMHKSCMDGNPCFQQMLYREC